MTRVEATPGIHIAVAVLGFQLKARAPVLKPNDHGLLAAREKSPGKAFEVWVSH